MKRRELADVLNRRRIDIAYMCAARRLDGKDQKQNDWVRDTSYTITETQQTEMESAL